MSTVIILWLLYFIFKTVYRKPAKKTFYSLPKSETKFICKPDPRRKEIDYRNHEKSFEIEGVRFNNSESAYIAAAFSLGTEEHLALQHKLVNNTNGLLAKRGIRRPNTHLMRNDWEDFNVSWMQYVVWCKCMGNSEFAQKLVSIPREAVIIEDSTFQGGGTATFWGTRNAEMKRKSLDLKRKLKAQGWGDTAIKRELDACRLGKWAKVGVYRGKNVMGKILMDCREALLTGVPPKIDYDRLNDAEATGTVKKITR